MRRLSKTIEDIFTILFAAGLLIVVAAFERGAIGLTVFILCSAISVKWFREPVVS